MIVQLERGEQRRRCCEVCLVLLCNYLDAFWDAFLFDSGDRGIGRGADALLLATSKRMKSREIAVFRVGSQRVSLSLFRLLCFERKRLQHCIRVRGCAAGGDVSPIFE